MKRAHSWHLTRALSRLSEWPGATREYKDALAREMTAGYRILHAGCGWDRNSVSGPYKDDCEVIGVDLDETACERFHSRCWLADLAALPFGSGQFDLICSEYVLEHLEYPRRVFAEFSRVLRPGGVVITVAPNRSSYKSLAAMLTPHWFHTFAARHLRWNPREAKDVYQTFYRANTRSQLNSLAQASHLRLSQLKFVSNGPTWFARIPLLFQLGYVLHRIVDRLNLEPLKCAIITLLTKPGRQEHQNTNSPLTLRCLRCNLEEMSHVGDGYRCHNCAHTYRIRRNIINALD